MLLRVLLAAALLLASREARAGDAVDSCIRASAAGQALRDRGALLGAREKFIACARPACPKLIRRDCASWLGGVEASLPTVVPRARDAAGRDLADVRVFVDGQLRAERLDGRALPIDPGEHRVRFERAERAHGARPIEVRVVARQGERDRPVDVVFPAPPAPPPLTGGAPAPPARPARGRRVAGWIAAGTAAAAAGGFAFLGLRARGAVDDMRRDCAPGCPRSRVDAAERDALLANVSLGVGAAALGTAAWLFWVAPSGEGVVVALAARF